MGKMVVLVVDVQKGMIDEHPFNVERVITSIRAIIEMARQHHLEIIYVRHDGGRGIF